MGRPLYTSIDKYSAILCSIKLENNPRRFFIFYPLSNGKYFFRKLWSRKIICLGKVDKIFGHRPKILFIREISLEASGTRPKHFVEPFMAKNSHMMQGRQVISKQRIGFWQNLGLTALSSLF